ncbi:MAG: hypothetical protein ABI988_10475, partial [Nitrospirota bacterium]
MDRRAEINGGGGVADRGSTGRDLPDTCGKRGADVSLEAQARPRTQGVWRVIAQESRGRAAEADRGTRKALEAKWVLDGLRLSVRDDRE